MGLSVEMLTRATPRLRQKIAAADARGSGLLCILGALLPCPA